MAAEPGASLQRLIDFVNTFEVDGGIEALPQPDALAAWLDDHGLGPAGAVGPRALERAVEVREALRTVLRSHHDEVADADVEAANAVLATVTLQLQFSARGDAALQPARPDGIEAALGRLVAVIPAAAADGRWERAKICPSDDCQWAFYDQSRNRSRRWCSMEVCGNREKGRAFRSRHQRGD